MSYALLLVDDEPNLLAGLKRALRGSDFRIHTAGSGSEGLAVLAENSIDAVVSDHDMPGMNGTEFLARVRQHHPDTIRCVLTGNASLDMAIRAINDGEVYRFFVKPCDPVDLQVTLKQGLLQRDLVKKSARLLETSRKQGRVLEQIEEHHPGITHVEKDDEGCIVLDPARPGELEDLLKSMETEMESAQKRLAGKNAVSR